jgi:hypothetical protein
MHHDHQVAATWRERAVTGGCVLLVRAIASVLHD